MITINTEEEIQAAVERVLRNNLDILSVDKCSNYYRDFAVAVLRQNGALIEYFDDGIKGDVTCVALAMKKYRSVFSKHAIGAAAADQELQRIAQIKDKAERVDAIEFCLHEEQPVLIKGGPLPFVAEPEVKSTQHNRFFSSSTGTDVSDRNSTEEHYASYK